MAFSPRQLYRRYVGAVAYVCVRKPNGDEDTGAAFHVGSGTFATARHVVDGNTIIWFGTTQATVTPGKPRRNEFGPLAVRSVDDVILSEDPAVDLALIRCTRFVGTAVIPLWVGMDMIVTPLSNMTEPVLIMGFPRVPQTRSRGQDGHPTLVASTGEVTAVADPLLGKHPVFLVSPMARGGFSGGPAILDHGMCLGVVTESLFEGDKQYEHGFLAVLSIEPLLLLLRKHGLPPEQPHVSLLLDRVEAWEAKAKQGERDPKTEDGD
jgi:hypothetical protein